MSKTSWKCTNGIHIDKKRDLRMMMFVMMFVMMIVVVVVVVVLSSINDV